MDAMRKQLDVLMGANRNGDVTEVNRKYYDRDVCRLFLVGLCPHELFQLTKMDMGACPKVHSLQLRKEYEEAKAKGAHNYDRDLEDVIDRLIVECDRKITRALKRLEDEDAKAAIAISVSEVTQIPEVIELSKKIKEKLKEVDQLDLEGMTDDKIRALEEVEGLRAKRADKQSIVLLDAFNKDRASLPQPLLNPPPLAGLPILAPPDPHTQEMINEKLKKAEDLGEQGLVDEAQKAMEEAEALKKLAARLEPGLDSTKYTAADVRITDQKLRVCDICGAFLSVYDSDRRLADHFGGKLHLGYMQIREKLAELQEERTKSRKIDQSESDRRSKDRTGDRDMASGKERDRDREDRGDSREQGRDHDRRNRDRDQYHKRERGHDRERERDSDRSRSYDSRSRRRSRSRSLDRSRGYDRHRMDGQTRESLHDPNDTSEQSSGQIDSEGEHEEHNTLNSELQMGGNALVVPESQPLKDIEVQLPVIGTVFQSEIEAYDYYNAYARSSGFSIRRSKMVMRKDKTVTRRVFCCSKEGFRCKHPRGNPMKPRPVTRTGCKARMDIHLKDGKYVVSGFIEEHNHPFARPSESHMLRSQRKLQDPQTFDIENILSYLHEEIEVPQDLNLEDGNYTDYPSQRWCYEILKKAQEDKKKIRELSTELQREKRQSAVYREQLLLVLKEMEDHTNHLSRQVESIVDNVKPLEPRGSKELS